MTSTETILKNPAATQRDIARALMLDVLQAMPPLRAPLQRYITDAASAMTGSAPLPGMPGDVTGDERRQLADRLARFGHMYQLAGLAVRDSSIGQTAPELEQLLTTQGKRARFGSASEAVAAIGKPALEITFTGHPTNTNSVAAMRALRDVSTAIARAQQGQKTDIAGALKAFAATALLPTGKDGQPEKLSVPDEIRTMLYTLGNMYDDLPASYASFDAKLKEKYPDYQPETLKLNLRLHSWGSSGDKDGNSNVTADTTLLAIALHKQFILTRYAEAFGTLGDTATQATLNTALQGVNSCIQQLEAKQQAAGSGFFLTEAEFKKTSAELREATGTLSADALLAAAQNIHQSASGAHQTEALNLMRRIHLFGLHGGKIEYRETAEEFERITKLIDPAASAETLVKDSDIAKKVEALHLGDAAKTPYSTTDARPIAYHTLKRFELARDFPEMIEKQVLAECKGEANMLQAVALQRAVSTPDKPAALGVVPLFEEADTLQRAPEILKAALSNASYRAQLDMAAKLHQQPAHQQVQIAHSDNARRAGMPVARVLINKAHNDIRAALKGSGVALQFFEGGSQSDIYRGGLTPLTETADALGLRDFTKITSQGGDLLNYFNAPGSSARFISSTIAHNATPQPPEIFKAQHAKDAQLEKAVRGAHEAYNRFFETPGFGYFMRDIGFNTTSTAGNFSSRAGARGGKNVVDVSKMRTIGFSETLQHAGITPTWLGAQRLEGALEGGSAPAIHGMYGSSAILKDVIDRMAIGLARSDMQAIEQVAFKDNAGNALYPSDPNAANAGSVQTRDAIVAEYRAACRLVTKALTGKEPAIDMKTADFNTIRQSMIGLLPHLREPMEDQTVLTRSLQSLSKDVAEGDWHTLSLIHNAADTVHHGREPRIDDAAYRARCEAASQGQSRK